MRIGIEAQRIFRGQKHGMDRVAVELIKNLQQIDKKNEYFIFVKPDIDDQVISETENFKIVEIPNGPYPLWEQFHLPRRAKKLGCDLLHCTSNTAPLSMEIPLITTVHDIIYLENKASGVLTNGGSMYQKFGNVYRRFLVPKVVDKSENVITVSNFEKENMTRYFGSKISDKLQTIHNGVSTHFKCEIEPSKYDIVKRMYGLPDHYIFFLGSKDPRKNTERVIRTFMKFKQQFKSPHQLVMLNYSDNDLTTLLRSIDQDQMRDQIILPGYVKDEDLPYMYGLADVFLFPSLREGFGIPIIEAMSCGVPVITSNTSSMPEVAGDAAHLVDPHNEEDILKALVKIITDSEYSESLIKKGRLQSSKFSWESMAEKVLDTYKELYNKKNTK